jgi:hypothetical protein
MPVPGTAATTRSTPAHRDGLPDGRTRAVTLTNPDRTYPPGLAADRLEPVPMLGERPAMAVPVAWRDPRVYDQTAGLAAGVGGAA